MNDAFTDAPCTLLQPHTTTHACLLIIRRYLAALIDRIMISCTCTFAISSWTLNMHREQISANINKNDLTFIWRIIIGSECWISFFKNQAEVEESKQKHVISCKFLDFSQHPRDCALRICSSVRMSTDFECNVHKQAEL